MGAHDSAAPTLEVHDAQENDVSEELGSCDELHYQFRAFQLAKDVVETFNFFWRKYL